MRARSPARAEGRLRAPRPGRGTIRSHGPARYRPRGRARRAQCRARPPDGRARRADREPGPDDLRLPGGGREPGLLAAARPRAPGSLQAGALAGGGGAPLDRRRDVRHLHELRQPDRRGPARGHSVGAALHRLRPQARSMTTETKASVAGDAVREAPLVTIDDVRRAAMNLAGVALRTPLLPFGTAGPGGPRVLLKAESLQPIG